MGAFEISSEGHLLFSKLISSYFPNTMSVTEKIISFAKDLR
jgi:ABC-type phosphate transport system auxiliary subunit